MKAQAADSCASADTPRSPPSARQGRHKHPRVNATAAGAAVQTGLGNAVSPVDSAGLAQQVRILGDAIRTWTQCTYTHIMSTLVGLSSAGQA